MGWIPTPAGARLKIDEWTLLDLLLLYGLYVIGLEEIYFDSVVGIVILSFC